MRIKYSKVITEPDIEPITLDEAKIDLKIDADFNDEDELITLLIQAARETVEQRTGRSLITQTKEMKLDFFPRCHPFDGMTLIGGPIDEDSIVIKYIDLDEVEQTIDSDEYWVDASSNITRVVAKVSWPSTFQMPNAVTVTYDSGYGDTSDTVPAKLRKAIMFLVGHFYENRQTVSIGSTVTEIPMTAEYLMNEYIIEQNVIQ